MNRLRAAVLVFALALAPAGARAAFEDNGFGPRDVAMGGAFTAVTDDPAVVAYNPAALGQASATDASLAYLRQFHVPSGASDRDQSRAAAVVPVRQDILNGGIGIDSRYDRRTTVGTDRAVNLHYGTRGLFETERGGLDFGGGFRFMSSTFEDGSKAGLHAALDFGALLRFSDRFSAGASLLNFGSPHFNSAAVHERAPLTLKLGVAEQLRGFTLAFDLTKREPSSIYLSGQHTAAAGAERWWSTPRAGQYALRTGLSMGDGAHLWTWGLGWRTNGVRLDYAMTVPMSGNSRFGHGVALSVRFGRADPEAEYERLLAGELASRRRLGEQLEAGAVKQWKLSEELSRLREEIAALRLELDKKRASESDARARLGDLERRRLQAAAEYERLKAERSGAALAAREAMFRDDWQAYQRAKLAGAPDARLLDQVSRLLREYKDSGVDLGEANRELLRLQRAH